MNQEPCLAQRIRDARLNPGEVAVFFIAQAGFVIKTASGTQVIIDPYLSDCVERVVGFKRMIPSMLRAEEIEADIFIATHNHLDHLDTDIMPVLAGKSGLNFIGAVDCAEAFREAGVDNSRMFLLRQGDTRRIGEVKIRAVFCDHGKLAPEAIGLMISIGDVTIYNVGDSAFALEKIKNSVGELKIDIMNAPINGAYGNLSENEACRLAAELKPRVLIGSHFGMFVEQGGSPMLFLEHAAKLEETTPVVMSPGECLRYSHADGIISRRSMAQEINE